MPSSRAAGGSGPVDVTQTWRQRFYFNADILCSRRPSCVSGRLAAKAMIVVSSPRNLHDEEKKRKTTSYGARASLLYKNTWIEKLGSSLFLHMFVSFVDFKVPVKTSVRFELFVFDLFLSPQPDYSSRTFIVWASAEVLETSPHPIKWYNLTRSLTVSL